MAESFTKLYDGKLQKRILRKETIEVRDPVLIVFAGGIRSRILSLLTYEQVASGFLPRFVFVTAESDITQLRPLGPPSDRSTGRRDALQQRLQMMYNHYHSDQMITVNGRTQAMTRRWDAELTKDAWQRYGRFEADMLQIGLKAMQSDILTPTMERLAMSGLKAAVLIAATRKLHDQKVVVEEADLVKAFSYVDSWKHFALEVITNIGKSVQENQIALVLGQIIRRPGILKSEIMRNYHYTAREMGIIIDTLEQRGQITRHRQGKTEKFFSVS
jgi:hypothetical protein